MMSPLVLSCVRSDHVILSSVMMCVRTFLSVYSKNGATLLLCSNLLILLFLFGCISKSEMNVESENPLEDTRQSVGNADIDVIEPPPNQKVLSSSTSLGIETLRDCLDYGSYYKIYVDRVFTANQISGQCEEIPVIVHYIGVSDEIYDNDLSSRALSLNKFLVLDKIVNMKIYSTSLVEGVVDVQAELFVGGESVSGRLLSSGLVKLDALPQNFLKQEDFENYQREAENRQLGIWKGLIDQLEQDTHPGDSKNPVPVLGCGTLPCRPAP